MEPTWGRVKMQTLADRDENIIQRREARGTERDEHERKNTSQDTVRQREEQ